MVNYSPTHLLSEPYRGTRGCCTSLLFWDRFTVLLPLPERFRGNAGLTQPSPRFGYFDSDQWSFTRITLVCWDGTDAMCFIIARNPFITPLSMRCLIIGCVPFQFMTPRIAKLIRHVFLRVRSSRDSILQVDNGLTSFLWWSITAHHTSKRKIRKQYSQFDLVTTVFQKLKPLANGAGFCEIIEKLRTCGNYIWLSCRSPMIDQWQGHYFEVSINIWIKLYHY